MSYNLSKLQCVKVLPDGWQAACPVCRSQGTDKSGNHLKIFKNGAFNCIVAGDDITHNRAIRSILKGFSDDEEIIFIDPEPKLTVEKVYPEESLNKLIPDYSYWLGRGMKETVLRQLENGVAPKEEKSKLSGRSIFPLRNLDGQIAGFSGRLIEENSFAPKWKHLAKISRLVYPWNIVGNEVTRQKKAVLVESIGDLLALLGADIKPTLCIFGLNLNSNIISMLVGSDVKKVVVSLNNDGDEKKGNGAAKRLKTKLESFWAPENVIVRLPKSKDWGCAPIEELEEFKKEIEAL